MNVLKQIRAAQLQELTVNCGLTKSGTKTALWNNLAQVPTDTNIGASIQKGSYSHNVLSIDLGLKNIALCYMTVPTGDKNHSDYAQLPTVHKWLVTDLMGWTDTGAFYQPQFAKLAYDFIQDNIFDYCVQPQQFPIDVVLIEEQRIRSRGAGEVPETIARLNILEAMIHAILMTRRQSYSHHEHGFNYNNDRSENTNWPTAVSMSPSRVMGYWVRASDPNVRGKLSNSKRYALTKSIKKTIVSNWIREAKAAQSQEKNGTKDNNHNKSILILEDGALEAADMVHEPKSKKTDDLCDALLQGMTWMHWNQNRHLISPEIFEDLNAFNRVLSTSNNRWRSACLSYPAAYS